MKPVDVLFPEAAILRGHGICPACKQEVGTLSNALSVLEYQVSGMCQKCQDEVFLDE